MSAAALPIRLPPLPHKKSVFMYPFLAVFLTDSGLALSMVCAVVGLGFALYLIKSILGSPAGNEKMRQIAGAIEEGAKAISGGRCGRLR